MLVSHPIPVVSMDKRRQSASPHQKDQRLTEGSGKTRGRCGCSLARKENG